MKITVSLDILVSTKSKGSDDLNKIGICDIWKYIKFLWIEDYSNVGWYLHLFQMFSTSYEKKVSIGYLEVLWELAGT